MDDIKEKLIDERLLLAKERTTLANERNRLANQRTFLSWIRTGLAGVGGGVGIIRLLKFQVPLHQVAADVAGLILIIWGIFIFGLSYIDYKRSSKKLHLEGDQGISLQVIAILSLTLIVLSLIILMIV